MISAKLAEDKVTSINIGRIEACQGNRICTEKRTGNDRSSPSLCNRQCAKIGIKCPQVNFVYTILETVNAIATKAYKE
jgi:hypothetical protein